jgi:uncharacterized protein YbaR (Trm112 family)
MFIELVDSLRCPHAHEESWLVLGAERMDGRDVMDGVLGCPVCRAQYRIAGGGAGLRAADGAVPPPGGTAPAADAEQAMRLAAFLNLAGGGGYAVLVGEWTRHAGGVQALAETHLLLVNPRPGVRIGGGTSGVLVDRVLPVAPGSARGLALDASVDASFAAAALRGVQARGRVLAPASLPLPDGVSELARDGAVWVAERDVPPSGLVSLSRGER